MKRIPCMIITCILLFLCVVPVNVSATTHAPARVINVVYDDSGSMYSGVDTWCRAKYSMEVFSAMLGDTDKMNVYKALNGITFRPMPFRMTAKITSL